jgi:predicted enzyme related to lactoylglutathione lyase
VFPGVQRRLGRAIFGCVRVTGVTANLPVSDIEAARRFYADYLGLGVEEMNLGWVAPLPDRGRTGVGPGRHS